MQQIIQSLKTGEIQLEDVPCPNIGAKSLLIASECSLISAGTERSLLSFGRSSMVGKIKSQPDKVKMVLDKVKTDGLMDTLDAVRSKLDQPMPLGYCNVGRVIAVGQDVTAYQVGDRVLSNGPHAEVVTVPELLCAKIPDNVSSEQAVFTVLGSIALQGIRLANPTLGERVCVIGLGVVGLLTVQLLIANGCQVLASDFDDAKVDLAASYGAEPVYLSKKANLVDHANTWTQGEGIDAVIITAASDSHEIIKEAAHISRQRGRIILVGVTGLNLSRSDFYEKELSFQVSCSYGPGRYDDNYEQKGQDYPLPFVRWTENRNFQAILALLAAQKLVVNNMISKCFSMADAAKAYDMLENDRSAMGILIEYKTQTPEALQEKTVEIQYAEAQPAIPQDQPAAGVIGAGNFASRVLIPLLKKLNMPLKTLASNQGTSAAIHGRKNGFEQATTDLSVLFSDQTTSIIFVLSQHHHHANQALSALNAQKAVFVEKPLALTHSECDEIESAYSKQKNAFVMLGFNRRFAPMTQKMKALLAPYANTPKALIMTVNAGFIPEDSWIHDPKRGGRRLMGEACHFIDLIRYLVDRPIKTASVTSIQEHDQVVHDCITIQLAFEDGSIGTVHYLANGSKKYPKEQLQVFCKEKILHLKQFNRLEGYGFRGFKHMTSWRQDKGHEAGLSATLEAHKAGKPAPIPFEEIMEITRICIDLQAQLDESTK